MAFSEILTHMDAPFHPNADIAENVIRCAFSGVGFMFEQVGLEPRYVETDEERNSLLFGELQGKRFLVYVRITMEEESETGTGPIPGLLMKVAQELEAEPHVIRVHMRKEGAGYGLTYFGDKEFKDAVRSSTELR